MTSGYTSVRTDVRRVMRGLWPMAAEPGPDFRWGVLLRRSKYSRKVGANGEVILFEESTDRQELEVVWHIRNNDMGVIVEVYKDIASGWKPGAPRPRFKHALVDLAAGKIDGIAVLNIDRLTRRKDQVRPVLNALEEMGGRLFSLEDELDTADDNPDSNTELRLHELVARAEREARRTSERMRLMARHRARKGLHQNGSRRPYGHTADYHGLVPHEAEVLNEAARRVVIDEGVYTIARDFTAREIPTATGKTVWQHDVLRQMLLSARMVGKREYNDTLFDIDYMPAILPEQLWEQVRAKLTPKRRPGRRENRELSNIVLCGICKLPMIGDTDDGARTYNCKKRPAEPGACGGVVVRAAFVEDKVRRELVAFLNDRPRVEALLERYRLDDHGQAAIDARFAELEDAKAALEEDRYNPPPGMKPLPAERYWTRRGEIEAEQERLQRRRTVNREAEPLRASLRQTWTEEAWEATALEYRRAILRIACGRIEIARDERQGGAKKGQVGGTHNPDRVRITFADEEA
jgi:DNA invertase Pin-like site-specific DNA recombinase